MTREQIIVQLTTIFRKVFDYNTLILTENMTAQNIKGWDLAQHIHLMLAIEQQLNI